jgi:hypothetical protein
VLSIHLKGTFHLTNLGAPGSFSRRAQAMLAVLSRQPVSGMTMFDVTEN